MTLSVKKNCPLAVSRDIFCATGLVLLAAMLGNYVTIPNIPSWYAHLSPPPLTPPNWLFGPVWTFLYALMAYAFFRILRLQTTKTERLSAIAVFVLQLILNASWSFAFFGAHNPLAGIFVILPMETLILVAIFLFRTLDPVAGYCLVPYAAWVAFATYLNIGFWILNA